jgi:hypothetical protein
VVNFTQTRSNRTERLLFAAVPRGYAESDHGDHGGPAN